MSLNHYFFLLTLVSTPMILTISYSSSSCLFSFSASLCCLASRSLRLYSSSKMRFSILTFSNSALLLSSSCWVCYLSSSLLSASTANAIFSLCSFTSLFGLVAAFSYSSLCASSYSFTLLISAVTWLSRSVQAGVIPDSFGSGPKVCCIALY